MSDPLTWTVRAVVERIVDGDTFVAEFDLGWGIYRKDVKGSPCRVRILNYNTPERGALEYQRAVEVLAAIIPPGTKVWVVSHKLDSFGRALCDVILPDGNNLLSVLPKEWHIEK
jgi:endonuclease YncB( thermonuclease family)